MADRRRGQLATQPEYAALREACPDCKNFAADDIYVYNRMLLLFTGIQAAGPRLTPSSFDQGLRALPPHPPGDPFAPTAYFGPGDHTFVKDKALAWWDASGQSPGLTSGPGCWRLVDDGHRYQAEEWLQRKDDSGIQQITPEQPCQADRTYIDPNSANDG
jgi:hypothetical protein